MDWKKASALWLTTTIVGFYTTLVIQNLWNWFVATAFNIPSVSYWQMYGVGLLISVFFRPGTEFVDEQRWNLIFAVLDFCVPEEKMEDLKEVVKQRGEQLWLQVGVNIFSRVVGNTATLALGWTVHTFLT